MVPDVVQGWCRVLQEKTGSVQGFAALVRAKRVFVQANATLVQGPANKSRLQVGLYRGDSLSLPAHIGLFAYPLLLVYNWPYQIFRAGSV